MNKLFMVSVVIALTTVQCIAGGTAVRCNVKEDARNNVEYYLDNYLKLSRKKNLSLEDEYKLHEAKFHIESLSNLCIKKQKVIINKIFKFFIKNKLEHDDIQYIAKILSSINISCMKSTIKENLKIVFSDKTIPANSEALLSMLFSPCFLFSAEIVTYSLEIFEYLINRQKDKYYKSISEIMIFVIKFLDSRLSIHYTNESKELNKSTIESLISEYATGESRQHIFYDYIVPYANNVHDEQFNKTFIRIRKDFAI